MKRKGSTGKKSGTPSICLRDTTVVFGRRCFGVWEELRKKEVDGVVVLPETRPEGWKDVEALGIFTPEPVEGEGDVIWLYPCLKGLLDRL